MKRINCFLGMILVNSSAFGRDIAMPTLQISLPQIEVTLDPHVMEDAYSMLVISQLHRGLLRYTPAGEVQPSLAESWQELENGRIYRFKLRDALFSDGTKINAKHVVLSIARIFIQEASIGADLELIRGVQKFRVSKNIEDLGVRSINSNEVEIELTQPSSIILKQLAAVDCAILKLENDNLLNISQKFQVFSGPYKTEKNEKKKIVLVKWRADYLDSTNPPGRIEFNIGGHSPFERAQAGTNDVLDWDVLSSAETEYLINAGWKRSVTDLVFEHFVILNPKTISLKIRRYLFKKTDQGSLATGAGQISYEPAFGLIPTGVPGALKSDEMAAIKSEVNTDTPKGSIFLQYTKGPSPAAFEFASRLKKMWETVDFKVNLVPMSHDQLLKDMFNSRGEAIIGGKGLDYFDGYSILTYFRSSYASNYFHVNSKKIDVELDTAAAILDPVKRIEKYVSIQKDVLREFTIIPLVFGSESAGLWGPRVKSVPAHPGGLHTLPLEMITMQ